MDRLDLQKEVQACVNGNKERMKLLAKISGFSKHTLRLIAGGRYVPIDRSRDAIMVAIKKMPPPKQADPGGPEAA